MASGLQQSKDDFRSKAPSTTTTTTTKTVTSTAGVKAKHRGAGCSSSRWVFLDVQVQRRSISPDVTRDGGPTELGDRLAGTDTADRGRPWDLYTDFRQRVFPGDKDRPLCVGGRRQTGRRTFYTSRRPHPQRAATGRHCRYEGRRSATKFGIETHQGWPKLWLTDLSQVSDEAWSTSAEGNQSTEDTTCQKRYTIAMFNACCKYSSFINYPRRGHVLPWCVYLFAGTCSPLKMKK